MAGADDETVYVVDTSSWLDIEHQSDNRAWAVVSRLIEEGRLKSPSRVIEEINEENPIYEKLKPYIGQLRVSRSDATFLLKKGNICYQHPGMARSRSRKNPGEIYVIALAELHGWTVVANESMKRRKNRKVPGVCLQRGIPCISLNDLVEREALDGE